MKVTRKDPFTGKVHMIDLPVTNEQMAAYEAGELIQAAFPHLDADQRELIMTGIMPSSWKAIFKEEAE